MRWDAAKYDATHTAQNDAGMDLIAMADVQPHDAVLDIGCGTATLTVELARRAAPGTVTGLDASAEMLASAEQKIAAAGNITLMHAAAQEMDFDAQFDLVYSNSALQWVKEHEAVMARIFRALKSNGRIALQLPAKDFCWELTDNINSAAAAVGMQDKFAKLDSPWRFPVKDEFAGLLREAGFANVQTFYREYVMTFAGTSEALQWGMAAALLPYLGLMDEKKRERFTYAFAMGFENYRTDRGIEFGFRRLFALGEKK